MGVDPGKKRNFAIFSAVAIMSAVVSSSSMPTSRTAPRPISPTMRPSTVTLPRMTRCTTVFIASPRRPGCSGRCRRAD